MTTAERVCLLTGARGFLGGYLALEAARRGYRVVDTGAMRLPCDDLRGLVRETRPGVVLHAAGPASVAASFDDPNQDFVGSVLATRSLLEALRCEAPGARVLYLSSAAVYGDPVSLPIGEDAPTRPISPYGSHRRLAELLVQQYAMLHGIPGASARIFSAYGPGLARQVVHDLIRRVHAAEPLRLDGTGEETRDFIHGADVARAALTIVERGSCQGEAYNVASGHETTLRTLAEMIRTLTWPGPVVFSGVQRRGDPVRWRADTTALAALGFHTQTPLAEGLRQVRDACGITPPA